jgi:cell wall-associated NlpC family hydrolase
MRLPLVTVLLCCGVGLYTLAAQDVDYRHSNPGPQVQNVASHKDHDPIFTLDKDDRLSILAAALESRPRHSERDCSHLVHAIYAQAGFPYSYAPSSEIFAGVEAFQRVKQPEPGDLIVWRGHVGIVINPSQHTFFSYLRSGIGTDDYEAAYWKHRGHARFYRYVKNDVCDECSRSRSNHLVKVKR